MGQGSIAMGLTDAFPANVMNIHADGSVEDVRILRADAGADAIPMPGTREYERAAAKAGVITTSVEHVIQWGRYSSVWPALFGLACCAIEMMATGASRYDIARFGMERFAATPRQADLMIVAGRVSQKMGPVLRQLYDQMAEPKWVVSMGACASSGGMFNNYAIIQGVDKLVPVDVYIPGCPPRPESLLDALIKLQKKIALERPESLRG